MQFGELRLPEGEGPFPVVVIIHGGCWMAAFNLKHISPLAGAVTGLGLATWSLEYRRVGDKGGGWPGTFADVAAGMDFLRVLAAEHPLDLERIAAMGHSAGGHLALWLAGRKKLSDSSILYMENPLIPSGVVSLAGIGDLADAASRKICGTSVLQLMEGGPNEFPGRYAQGSPDALLPFGVKQVLVQGSLDPIVPVDSARAYYSKAMERGDDVELDLIKDAGHFELVTPGSIAWPRVRDKLLSLLNFY